MGLCQGLLWQHKFHAEPVGCSQPLWMLWEAGCPTMRRRDATAAEAEFSASWCGDVSQHPQGLGYPWKTCAGLHPPGLSRAVLCPLCPCADSQFVLVHHGESGASRVTQFQPCELNPAAGTVQWSGWGSCSGSAELISRHRPLKETGWDFPAWAPWCICCPGFLGR